MRLKRVMKRIVALGTGATMVGATLLGAAAAADLKDYPSPFIKDGKFNALIVVGDEAASSDVIGSVDVAASLQYASRVKKSVSTAAAGTTSVDDGVQVQTAGQKLRYQYWMNSVKETITSSDWKTLLASGTFTDNTGASFTYTQQVKVPKARVNFGKTQLDLNEPVLFVDWQENESSTALSYPTYWVQIDFPTATNLSKATNKVIKMLGKEFTFDGSVTNIDVATAGSEKITLFGGGLDQTFEAGDKTTVTVGGIEIPVEVTGVNTQTATASATIIVNGESSSVTSGNTYILGGIRVYVRDIMAYTAPSTSGKVRLFIGTDKYVLEHGQTITYGDGNKDLDGVKAYFASASGKVSKINISVTPYRFSTAVKGTQKGGEVVDPFFGTFKLMFTGEYPALDASSKDLTTLTPSSTDRLKLGFTNKNDQKYEVEIFQGNTTTNAQEIYYKTGSSYDFIVDPSATGRPVHENDYFIIDYSGYSHILRLTTVKNSSTGKSIKVKDEAGETNTWTVSSGFTTNNKGTGTMIYDGHSYSFNAWYDDTSAAANYINLSSTPVEVARSIFTKGGAKITLPQTDAVGTNNQLISNVTRTNTTSIILDEEDTTHNYNSGTPDACGMVYFNVTYDQSRSGNKMRVSTPTYIRDTTCTVNVPADWSTAIQVGTSGYDYAAVTPYGTYVKYNSDTSRSDAKAYYSTDETRYDAFLAPIGAKATTATSEEGALTYYETNKIEVGAAKLASEVTDVKAQNVILVGGPCANSAAAEIMGNPAVCTEGFEEGKALLKLYENAGNVALLVAGFSAMDTRRASRVISDYDKYKLSGAEMEVSGTSLTDITVSAPAAE